MAEIDCTNNDLSKDDYIRSILGNDGNGNCAIRLLEVVDGDAPYEDCNLNDLSAIELLQMLIDVNGNGKLALRVISGVDNDTNCVSCNDTDLDLKHLFFHNVVGLSSDGKPALRITI